ncbi:hypothetical protein [Streptomyces sp. NRRL WC-3742]|uniref:hypothetical protein n=1 Tax=Streptomyces sp. NRRL WC-3742 TaxID=1463934 RepID=UPI0004C88E5C|nr:hypothetical protein [Streptomyces sp. NRRL WC-3742]
MRIASAVVAATVLFGTATACGSSKSNDQKTASVGDAASAAPAAAKPDGDPKAQLTASALVMQKAGNSKVEVDEAGDPDPSTGDAHWNNPSKPAVDLTSKTDGKPLHLRVVGADAYLGTEALGAKAPSGKTWMRMPATSALGGGLQVAALMVNPVVQLTVAAQSGKLTKLDPEDVGGAKATHIRATEDSSVLIAGMTGLSAEQHAAVQRVVELEGKTLTVDFWINDKLELVKLQEHGDAKGSQDPTTVKYSGLGKAAPVEAPAAKDVADGDLSKLLG